MTEVEQRDSHQGIAISSVLHAELVNVCATDRMVAQAAHVSTKGEAVLTEQQAAQSFEEANKQLAKDLGLINFLMRDRHGTPFEHNMFTFFVKAPIAVFREFQRHRIGFCLPGSAQIPVGTWKNGVTKPIAKVYSDWKEGVPDTRGRVRMLPSTQNLVTRTLNLETGLIEHERMVDVYKSGVKPLVKVQLASGHVLRCTPEHRVWTDHGWVAAGDLTTNSVVARVGKVVTGKPLGVPRRLREGIQFWVTEQKPNVVSVVDVCYVCEEKFPYRSLQVDHVVPVAVNLARALDITNLAPICRRCHRKKTNGEQVLARRRTQQLGARFEGVVSVRSDGREMTYDIEMPAPWHNFVADGVVVHNSYNEESGRYKKLSPEFYVPPFYRPLQQQGKPGAYEYFQGEDHTAQHARTVTTMKMHFADCYERYEALLEDNVAREVARGVLPVYIYSSMYVTCNARSLMHFLSLRTRNGDSAFKSFPMWEIEQVANQMEVLFAQTMPLTHDAFCKHRRVAP